jgi:hypothetical protein
MTTMQQWQLTITDKPAKTRGKPVRTVYVVAAASRDEAVAIFDEEVGAHHRELALSWSCASTLSRVARAI